MAGNRSHGCTARTRGQPSAPDVPYLVGALDEECFVPYCIDEYTQFKGSESDRIAAAENELIDRADVVVTTSTWLEGTGRQPVPSG